MMCKIPFVKRKKKDTSARLTIFDTMFGEFFLGDIVYTFLPIGISLLLSYFLGKFNYSILLNSDWPFFSIIIFSLALHRSLELKIIHQKDTSQKALFLASICLVFIILSATSLLVYTLRQQGAVKVSDNLIISFQTFLIVVGILLLGLVSFFKQQLFFNRREFPRNILIVDFHNCLQDNLNEAKDRIRANSLALKKEYKFSERNDDLYKMEEYGKLELKQLVEDIQNDLTTFKQRLDAWDKPPYHSATPPEQQKNESL